jgi:hypothetical protein
MPWKHIMNNVQTSFAQRVIHVVLISVMFSSCSPLLRSAENDHPATPEAVVRAMFDANARRNMADLERLVSKDVDMIGYSIGGRKYVGWDELQREMQQEFETVTRLNIPIKELRVWTRGDIAWYTADIEYIRYEGIGQDERRTVLALRESGVLEHRQGRWLLVQWHESLERPVQTHLVLAQGHIPPTPGTELERSIDLSGEWEIQEEDKTYGAVLDASGRVTYTWQQGMFVTTRLADGDWEGTWHQTGNDREGGFEVHFAEDLTKAKGTWWYTRVGTRVNIPPRQWGGEYRLTRINPGAILYSNPQ